MTEQPVDSPDAEDRAHEGADEEARYIEPADGSDRVGHQRPLHDKHPKD